MEPSGDRYNMGFPGRSPSGQTGFPLKGAWNFAYGWEAAWPVQRGPSVGTGHSARIGGLQPQQLKWAEWTATEAFKKSGIPCRTGKASIVLGAWTGNSWEQGPCRNEPELLNPSSGRSSKLGPSGGMTCRLYWHITTTTSPCSTCRRRCSRAAWLNTRRPGICASPITNPGKPSMSKSYKCASATPPLLWLPSCVAGSFQFRLTIGLCKVDGAWRTQHEHHSVPVTD